MKKGLLILAAAVICLQSLAQTKATTEDGRQVLLYDNGTWKSADELDIKIAPQVMPVPSFKGIITTTSKSIKEQKLVQLSTTANSVTDVSEWFINNELDLPMYNVPNALMGETGNVPAGTPRSYKGHMLIQATHSDDHNFLVYGKDFSEGRFLIVTDKKMSTVQHVIDFENYLMSPEYVKEDLMFIGQGIKWVAMQGNVLYISHFHRTYAASSKNMNAYITAIDTRNYKVLWRTQPLVCNSLNFEVYNDMIICGYGFTKEPDFLYTINMHTGAVMQKLPLSSGPDYVIRKGDKVYVRTYSSDYIFRLQ